MAKRIYIFGASGSGVTTLGKALATRLGMAHIDSDDYYWQPTEISYTKVFPPAIRVENIQKQLRDHESRTHQREHLHPHREL